MINNKLSRIKILAFKIRRINEKIESLRYEMEYHTSIYSELPKNFDHNNNMIEIFISRIEKLEMKKVKILRGTKFLKKLGTVKPHVLDFGVKLKNIIHLNFSISSFERPVCKVMNL